MEAKLKLSKLGLMSGLLITSLFITNCAPTAQQLKDAVEKDPSIVFVAIEKHPDKFIEVVIKAQQEAQQAAQKRQVEEEEKRIENEFSNPLKPNISEERVIFGNKDAKITIVEYSDFECPFCSKGYFTVKEVLKQYANDVRVIFKHLPLDFHPNAMPAAQYFEAIAKQDHGKAQKFHDYIFENQSELKAKGKDFLKEAAKKVGADLKRVEKDLNSEDIMKRIEADTKEANEFGMTGTPGFIINGVSFRGAYPFAEFKRVIDRHLGKK